jgi:hypothetical protein
MRDVFVVIVPAQPVKFIQRNYDKNFIIPKNLRQFFQHTVTIKYDVGSAGSSR